MSLQKRIRQKKKVFFLELFDVVVFPLVRSPLTFSGFYAHPSVQDGEGEEKHPSSISIDIKSLVNVNVYPLRFYVFF